MWSTSPDARTVSVPPFCAPSGAAVGAGNFATSELTLVLLPPPPPQDDSANASAAISPGVTTQASFDRMLIPFCRGVFSWVNIDGSSLVGAGVEGVLHRVAHEVERQDREQKRQAREHHVPPGVGEDRG